MPNLLDLLKEPEPLLKILNWCPSGRGKSWLAATFPSPLYFFDFDGRIQSVLPVAIKRNKKIDFDSYLAADPTSYDRAFKKLEELIHAKPFPYKTVVCDTLTSLGDISMARGMPTAQKFYGHRRPTINVPGVMQPVEVPVMQDHQTSGALISKFVNTFYILPCHVILNAHEAEDKDGITNKIFKNVAVTGKQSIKIPGIFSELWRMEMEIKAGPDGKNKEYHRVITRPDHLYSARSCYADALAEFEEADFDVIYPKITSWIAAKRKELGIS